MQVILKKDMPKVGRKGQAINVKNGYAMNYLIPQGFAEFATDKLLEEAAEIEKKVQEELQAKKKEAQANYETINGKTVSVKAKLTKKGKLYAKITENKITELVKEQLNVNIAQNQVKIKEEIKEEGVKEGILIDLGSTITATIKVKVEGETE